MGHSSAFKPQMNKSHSAKFLISMALLLTLGLSSSRPGQALKSPGSTPEIPAGSPSGDSILYLPLIRKSYPAPPSIYGVETYDFAQWKLDKITQANISWVRSAAFSWAAIEPDAPSPGHTYNWEAVNNAGLIEAANRGLTTIAIIKDTPTWARMSKYSNYVCGPVNSASLDDYADFVHDLVLRYSDPPYNIKYYEFGNEPDVDPALFGTWYDPPFGCWGDASDFYYGGRYYGEMLKYVYPAVKTADPQSNVIIGGLLLNCDPTHPPPIPPGETCLPGKFLEGILRNQGAANFDIVAFHSYPSYSQGIILDETHPNFAYRGGQLVGKVDFLRYVMEEKFHVGKPIMMTEVAFKCQTANQCGDPPSENFLQLQADYVVHAYVRSWGLNLKGAIWYTLEDSGWEQTGLFDGTTARPAYNALVFMSNELKDATIGAPLTQFAGLRGYEFTIVNKRIWVLWAPDGVTGKSIPLPANVTNIYDKYGASITPTNPITIVHPTYFEFPR
jgi:hypothetical protein